MLDLLGKNFHIAEHLLIMHISNMKFPVISLKALQNTERSLTILMNLDIC